MTKEIVVIGAGYGGLAASALLQKYGYSVTLIEAHSLIGGCASFYKRKDYLFDVGATTFSGLKETQPVGQLFKELEIKPAFIHLNPGMIVFLNQKTIIRDNPLESWIQTCESVFGKQGQKEFWNLVYQINDLTWNFIQENPSLPPRTVQDFLSLLKPQNFSKISLIPYLFRTTKHILKKLGIDNPEFESFLSEQLIITTQSHIDEAPFISAALGLAYPSETYYPIGGMVAPAQLLLDHFQKNGGVYLKKEKVINIIKRNNNYLIITEKGKEKKADIVVANLPIWNLVSITKGKISHYYKKLTQKFPRGQGAFVINFGVKLKKDLPTNYFQIHSSTPLAFTESNSFFVSFSHRNDLIRAKAGSSAVTISIHTDPNDWLDLSKETYSQRKHLLGQTILNEFHLKFSEYLEIEEKTIQLGSPKTYQDYTFRLNGYVGGIPHKVFPSPLQFPNGKTPFRGFYQVGDTVFPGQGIPAVIYSALSVVRDIRKRF